MRVIFVLFIVLADTCGKSTSQTLALSQVLRLALNRLATSLWPKPRFLQSPVVYLLGIRIALPVKYQS